MRRLLILLFIGSFLLQGPPAAQARYGASYTAAIQAADGTWDATRTKHVHPGGHVVFLIRGKARSNPTLVNDPHITGCDGRHRFDVRYRLVRARHDHNVTRAVTRKGWTSPRGRDWDVFVRLSVRVANHATVGSSFSCEVHVNMETLGATVEVR